MRRSSINRSLLDPSGIGLAILARCAAFRLTLRTAAPERASAAATETVDVRRFRAWHPLAKPTDSVRWVSAQGALGKRRRVCRAAGMLGGSGTNRPRRVPTPTGSAAGSFTSADCVPSPNMFDGTDELRRAPLVHDTRSFPPAKGD